MPPGDLTDAVAALNATDPTAPIHIHIAEQVTEVRSCLSWNGASPVEWLLGHAPVDTRWCAVHATHMTAEETRALAASGAVAGLCPTTEANLGDGVFPLPSYQVAGGRWGVGSDSHVSVSPAADLRMLEYSQRLTMHERNVAGGREVHSTGRALLEGAWAGGAQASGRRLGAIRPGFRADLVVLDTDHPALVGRDEDQLLDAWIFSGEDTPRARRDGGRNLGGGGRPPPQTRGNRDRVPDGGPQARGSGLLWLAKLALRKADETWGPASFWGWSRPVGRRARRVRPRACPVGADRCESVLQ